MRLLKGPVQCELQEGIKGGRGLKREYNQFLTFISLDLL